MLGLSAVTLLLATFFIEQATEKLLTTSPEITQATLEEETIPEEE